MKILIYKNSFNNEDESLIKSIHLISKKYNFSSEVITEKDLIKSFNAQAIVILGGDGTILRVVDFVIKNNLLVIGVNFGTMGFLTEFEKGEVFATIESVKAASEIYMPISGKVEEINEAIVNSPELLNSDTCEEKWLIKISSEADSIELADLLDYSDYKEELE